MGVAPACSSTSTSASSGTPAHSSVFSWKRLLPVSRPCDGRRCLAVVEAVPLHSSFQPVCVLGF